MPLQFNEAKATQAACRLLQLRGGQMGYLKLLKLLYLIDREALLRWGRPVTTDRYVSMDRGPVLSRIYDLIVEEAAPGSETVWRRYVSEQQNYEVHLLDDPGGDELSEAEERLIEEISGKYGNWSKWDLVEFSHSLPEWQNPNGSAIPIAVRDILKAGGKTEVEIAAIEEDLENVAAVEALTTPR